MLLPFYYIYDTRYMHYTLFIMHYTLFIMHYALFIMHYPLSLISASNQISSRIYSQEDEEKNGETPQRTTAITEER